MRYFALATDYDGTLAHHGRVDAATLEALERLAATGRKLILVTGRELGDLQSVFPAIARFDLVVAENGASSTRPQPRPPVSWPTRRRRHSLKNCSVERMARDYCEAYEGLRRRAWRLSS